MSEKTPLNRKQQDSEVPYGASASSSERPVSLQEFRQQNHRNSLSSSLAESLRSVVDATFSFSGKQASIRDFGGRATIASEIATISKNLIGGGVLSLSGGIALCSKSPTAVVPASLWLVVLGAIFGYYCWLIGKLCKHTREVTYRELWLNTVGVHGQFAVPFVNAFKAGLGNLAYSAILSQTGVSLCQSIGLHVTRVESLLFITILMVLPLCLIKNLNALAPLAVMGTTGIIITAVSMIIRYFDGSYQPDGQYYNDLDPAYVPSFGKKNGAWGLGILPFLCMGFEAYVMHYNSARLYAELKNASLPRFASVVSGSFGFTALVYSIISSAGYLTFGSNSNSYILNNYSSQDPLATLCRSMVAFSTLMTYPIVFRGFSDGIVELLDIPLERQTENNLNLLTVILLTALTITATFVTDLGLINAVGGGTLATVMVFVFPTIMYRSMVREHGLVDEVHQVNFATFIMIVGIFLGVVGVYLSIMGD